MKPAGRGGVGLVERGLCRNGVAFAREPSAGVRDPIFIGDVAADAAAGALGAGAANGRNVGVVAAPGANGNWGEAGQLAARERAGEAAVGRDGAGNGRGGDRGEEVALRSGTGDPNSDCCRCAVLTG